MPLGLSAWQGGRAMAGSFRFSFGPWNTHDGADPFGPAVRWTLAFAKKIRLHKELGFDGVHFARIIGPLGWDMG